MSSTTMSEITQLCKSYADARDRLSAVSDEIRAMRRAAVRSRLRGLKSRVAEVSAAREVLRHAIEGSPQLFARPRTVAIEGIKVGYRKRPGMVECDPTRTINLIKDKLPKRAAELIKVREVLDKSALKKLEARELATIGAAVVMVDDEVVVQAASDDLDKLVDALLSDDDDDDD